jgi:hypothetical protein
MRLTMRNSSTLRALAVLAAATALTACKDHQTFAPPAVELVEFVPVGGVQVMLVQSAGPTEGTLRYRVRVIAREVDMAAYQGAVTFAPGAFEFLGIEHSDPTDGESHFVNAEGFKDGKIRFAAWATEKFKTDEAFAFIVRSTGAAAPNLSASLEVAGESTGAALSDAVLRASAGIRDSRGALIAQP